MVVLFFAIGKNNFNFSTREFADYLKKSIIAPTDQKKLNTMKDLIMDSLDSLLKTNDELVRFDLEMESFLKVLEKKCLELDPQFKFLVNNKDDIVGVEDAIARFSWDEHKYPKNHKTIEEVIDRISYKYNITKNNFKTKTDDFTAESEKLKQKVKSDNEAAGLMKVDYREIIKRSQNHMIATDYLRTMLCFVPTSSVEFFLKSYVDIADEMVLPYSAHQLDSGEDEKMTLWRVLVMDHKKEEFIQQARFKFKAFVKEYDEEEIRRLPKEIDERQKLTQIVQTKKNELVGICKSLYSDMYNLLLHLKFLRLHTESTLKYGTSEFYSCVVITNPGKETKVVSQMIKAFTESGDQGWYGTKEELKDTEDFYPFILIKLSCPTFL